MGLTEFNSIVKKIFIALSIIIVFHNIYKEKSVITKSDIGVNLTFIPIYLLLLIAEILTIYNI